MKLSFEYGQGMMSAELPDTTDVFIPGETVDWTVVEYVQDSLTLGKKRALLNPGHFNWEEPGLE